MLKAESQTSEKHLAYKVRLDSFQQEVKTTCLENKDTWANEILARIDYARESKSFDMKGEDVFLQAVNYLWENSEKQLTIHD